MTAVPVISEPDIREWVDGTSFQRGWEYFEGGAIFNGRREGLILKASCEGSSAPSYQLWASLGPRSIASGGCSCPVGADGRCKHVAALLLTWLARPEAFLVVEDLGEALDACSKEELVTLVKQMLKARPELRGLLDGAKAGDGAQSSLPDPEPYRRQAAAILRRGFGGWQDDGYDAGDLLPLTGLGDGFLEGGRYGSAVAVFTGVATEVLDYYREVNDDEGDLGEVVSACVHGLGRCLARERENQAVRHAALEGLFAIYSLDVEYGGVGLGDDVPDLVLEHGTREERRTMAAWVRSALAASSERGHSSWGRETYGGFLLDLEADVLDDEAFLQVCRESGRTADLVDRLLALGRVDEAAAEGETAGDYTLLQLADSFVRHGEQALAERLMRTRAESTTDVRLPSWLKDHYRSRQDLPAALDFADQTFRLRPSVEGFQELQELAGPLGRWEEVRREMLRFLEEQDYPGMLVRISLAEGDVAAALEGLRRFFPPAGAYDPGARLRLEVAAAAEPSYPRDARKIYQQQVEALIAVRGRGHYQSACGLLTKMRALYATLGEQEAWLSYIAGLRERHRTLRALKEELAWAKL